MFVLRNQSGNLRHFIQFFYTSMELLVLCLIVGEMITNCANLAFLALIGALMIVGMCLSFQLYQL